MVILLWDQATVDYDMGEQAIERASTKTTITPTFGTKTLPLAEKLSKPRCYSYTTSRTQERLQTYALKSVMIRRSITHNFISHIDSDCHKELVSRRHYHMRVNYYEQKFCYRYVVPSRLHSCLRSTNGIVMCLEWILTCRRSVLIPQERLRTQFSF